MRGRYIGVAALSAVWTLWFLISAGYSQTTGRSTITGFIFGPKRVPVAQVFVELKNDVNSVVGRVRADDSGRYLFRGVASGRYSITVLPLGTGFEEQSQEVEIAGVSGRGQPIPENVQKDFYLRLRRTSATTVNAVIFAQEVPDEAKKLFERAVSDLKDGKSDKGIEGLLNALKLFPDYFLALEKLGLEYVQQQKYQEAKDVLTNCVRINAKSYSGWYGLGYSTYALEENEAAIDALKHAVEIDGAAVQAFFVLGIVQRRVKQYEQARTSLTKAEKLDLGKTPDIHWNLALLYAHNLERYDDAADELELFLKTGPDNPDAVNIGRLIKKFREQAKSSK